MSLGFRHIASLALLAVVSACGSFADPGDDTTSSSTSTAPAPADAAATGGTGTDDGSTGGADPGASRTRNADGAPLEVTGPTLCSDVPAATASQALGVAIDDAAAGDTATPQCTYSYTNAAGHDSTFTLAAMRPADIGGRTGLEAFDYMVELSRGLAGPVDLDQVDLAVGDKAVRITGGQVHTAVLASGGHLLTVTVPEADASADQVDALVTVVARALA